MLETLLNSPESSSLASSDFSFSASFFSVLEQYASLNPFMITGTALALYAGATLRRTFDHLAMPIAVVSLDNLFSLLFDSPYSFEQYGQDVVMECFFLFGAYCLGSLANYPRKLSSRRHRSERS